MPPETLPDPHPTTDEERAAIMAQIRAAAPPPLPDLPPLVLEPLDFACAECGANGGVPCVDEDGEPTAPHDGRAPLVGR